MACFDKTCVLQGSQGHKWNILLVRINCSCSNVHRQVFAIISKVNFHVTHWQLRSGYLKHVMAVFSRIGYTRTEARSRLFDVMWAHDYPFGGDLKEMLQHLEPHQKVRMPPPSLPSTLTHPPDPFVLHYNICLECAGNSSVSFTSLIITFCLTLPCICWFKQ